MNPWLEKLRAAFEGLAPRERWLVLGAGGMIVLSLLVFGLINPLITAAVVRLSASRAPKSN